MTPTRTLLNRIAATHAQLSGQYRQLGSLLDSWPGNPASVGDPPGASLSDNPLTAELLDLITLMPDSQTQEIQALG